MLDAFDIDVIAQGIGFIALFLGVYAYLSQDDRKLRILMSIQSCFLCSHFFLLDSMTASSVFAVLAVRNFFSLFYKARNFWPIFVVFYIVLGLYNYQEWQDALPIVASCGTTYAYFKLSGIPMRLLLFNGAVLYFIHNVVVGSIGPSITELLLVVVTLSTIYRLYKETV